MPNCSALDWLGTLVDVVACFLGICTVLWFSVVREGRGGGGGASVRYAWAAVQVRFMVGR